MPDPRVSKLAQVLIHYSLKIKPGDKLQIRGATITTPLIRETYKEAVRAGAHVTVRADVEGLPEIFLREANDEQLNSVSELIKVETEHFDALLTLWGTENTKALSGSDPKRIAARQKVQ